MKHRNAMKHAINKQFRKLNRKNTFYTHRHPHTHTTIHACPCMTSRTHAARAHRRAYICKKILEQNLTSDKEFSIGFIITELVNSRTVVRALVLDCNVLNKKQ